MTDQTQPEEATRAHEGVQPFSAKLDIVTPGCPTNLLRFDVKNPRLEDGRDHSTDDDVDMIKSLREVAALNELISSIVTNTYRDIEPLIVMGAETGPFTVLEGNRRLACIKLLNDQSLALKCGVGIVADIPYAVKKSLEAVSVYRVASQEDARAFIGFKHINGPHRWESFAKARFVLDWYKQGRAGGLTVEEIADRLGDDNNTIRSMISGMLVLEQAEGRGFRVNDKFNRARFAFSHLYTALSRVEYQNFLGLEKGWMAEPSENPVDEEFLPRLDEVMLWLYGSRSQKIEPVIKSQNPDLANLGTVLKHESALQVIRARHPLPVAMAVIRPAVAQLASMMVDIARRLEEAVGVAGKNTKATAAMCETASSIFVLSRSLNSLVSGAADTSEAKDGNNGEG